MPGGKISVFTCIFILGIFPLLLLAEGTKEIMPNAGETAQLLIANGTVSGQARDPFAIYNGLADYRLFIHIEDYTTEVIHFGLGQSSGSAVTWRIHQPDGTVDWTGTTPSATQPGYINNYTEAVSGPLILNPTGYSSLSYTPTLNGDFFMTFQVSNNSQRVYDFFDITVVKTVPSPTAKPGRVFSKCWQIRNPAFGFPSQYYLFYGNLFIYSPDGIVTKLDPNGFEGRDFSVSCNESGCYPVGPGMPANQARKSVSGRHTYPQFPIFLNDPDAAVYPSGVLGQLVNNNPVVQTVTHCEDGNVDFIFQVTAPGTMEISLGLSALGPQFTDRLLATTVTQGWDTIVWDGYDGSTPPVLIPSGSSFLFTGTYINGMTHLPIYDVENNASGFIVSLIRPAGPEPAFYWDDTALPALIPGPQQNPPGGCVSSVNPCHLWTNQGGDQRSINTWWYVANITTSPVAITQIRKPPAPGLITGPVSVCPGATGQIYWINEEPSSTSYVWAYTGTGATIVPVNDTTVSISFANDATSGNLTVAGVNVECGQGDNQIKTITILPAPVVSLASYPPVCIDTPPFTLTGGLPAGGTYIIGGLPVTIFNPASYGTGSHQVTYTYTDPSTTCTASDQKPIVVNPPPVVTLAAFAGVCVNTPPFSLSGGLPAGGTYSGPGVTAGIFDPATAGPGTHAITYTFTDANSCTSSDTKNLVVYALTPLSFPSPGSFCINAAPVPLTGGTPAGGTYSGPGVSSGIFNPAVAGAGVHQITYTYVDGNNCINLISSPVTVDPLPGTPGAITGSAAVCQGVVGVPYTATAILNATSYIWAVSPSSAGIVTGTTPAVSISWSSVFSGIAQITVKGQNGCGDGVTSAPFSVTVNPNPEVSFTSCFDTITLTTAKPITLKGGIPRNGSFTGAGISAGILNPVIAGAGTHIISYTYTNAMGCSKTATKSITIQTPAPWNCGDLLTDIRDGKQYPTAQIGSQCWMAASLNYGQQISSTNSQRDNCLVEKYCYNDNASGCTVSGGRYQWDEVMAYQSAEVVQGICPPGWHLPNETEWTSLFNNFTNNGFAGSALKVTGYSGFNALVAGFQGFNQGWQYGPANTVLRSTLYWSSTKQGRDKAWAHGINEVVAFIEYTPSASYYPSMRNNAFSVRCLKD